MPALSTVTLTLRMGPIAVTAVPKAVVDALDGATVTHAVGARSGFQLSFTYSKTSPIARSLLPSGYFDPMVRVVLVATLRGVAKVLADGPIRRQDVTATGRPGEHRLVVTGEDITGYMDLLDLTGLDYPAMPSAARVAVMMAKYLPLGVVPVTVPVPYEAIESPLGKTAKHQGTDFEYATGLAKATGYEFYVTPGPVPGANTAYWGPQIRHGSAQPALTIDMDTVSNVDSVTFSADGNAVVQPFGHVKVAGVSVPVPVPELSPFKPPLALRPLVPSRTKLQETDRFALPDVLKTLIAGGTAADPVTATGSMDLTRYGRPLDARSLVGVRGAGVTYDGVWFVRSVTHTLGRGSWKQSFQLARGGFNSHVTEVTP